MEAVESRVADTILDKGVRVHLPAPFLLRLFTRTVSITIRQPRYGALLKISALGSKLPFDALSGGNVDDIHRLMHDHVGTVMRIIAVVALGTKWRIKLFSRLLAWWLVWKLTPRKAAEILMVAIALAGTEDFTTTIRLIGAMKVTMPKNLSHINDGS